MATEIERKFLVLNEDFKKTAKGIPFKQAYLVAESGKTIRVRIAGEKAYLTIKGKSTGISRSEFEYEIPVEEAKAIFDSIDCSPTIEKIRYFVPFNNHIWEVDEFLGENSGLVVAEIELSSEDELFDKPSWIGDEVSFDKRYRNSYLSQYPYNKW